MWPSATALATATRAVAISPMASRWASKPAAWARPERLGGLGLGQADGLGAVGLGLAGEPHVGRLAAGLGLAGLGLVAR